MDVFVNTTTLPSRTLITLMIQLGFNIREVKNGLVVRTFLCISSLINRTLVQENKLKKTISLDSFKKGGEQPRW